MGTTKSSGSNLFGLQSFETKYVYLQGFKVAYVYEEDQVFYPYFIQVCLQVFKKPICRVISKKKCKY